MCWRPGPFKGFFGIIWIFILCILICYQSIISFFFPVPFNLIILFAEILLLFWILWRIIWPY